MSRKHVESVTSCLISLPGLDLLLPTRFTAKDGNCNGFEHYRITFQRW